MELEHQIAMVTGGGRGIGRAVALALAAAGARVAVVSRTGAELDETVASIEHAGGDALPVVADVTDREQVGQAVEHVVAALGPIDVLVNNAGFAGPLGAFWETDPEVWWEPVRINLQGTAICTHAVLGSMVARGRGRVINMASNAGAHRWPLASAYAVSKAAIIKFTENVAFETRKHGVSVFAIHPGLVLVGPTQATLLQDTVPGSPEADVQAWIRRQVQEGRHAEPERGAELAALLASGAADALSGRYLTVDDDVPALVACADEVRRDELYALAVRRLG